MLLKLIENYASAAFCQQLLVVFASLIQERFNKPVNLVVRDSS